MAARLSGTSGLGKPWWGWWNGIKTDIKWRCWVLSGGACLGCWLVITVLGCWRSYCWRCLTTWDWRWVGLFHCGSFVSLGCTSWLWVIWLRDIWLHWLSSFARTKSTNNCCLTIKKKKQLLVFSTTTTTTFIYTTKKKESEVKWSSPWWIKNLMNNKLHKIL